MPKSILWTGTTEYSVSAGSAETVSQVIFTLPPTAPTGPYATLWVMLASGTINGALETLDGTPALHHSLTFGVLPAVQATGFLGFTMPVVASYGGFIYSLNSSALIAGGNVTLAIDLGIEGVPLADAGAIIGILYDPGLPVGSIPRNTSMGRLTGGLAVEAVDENAEPTDAFAPYYEFQYGAVIGATVAPVFSTSDFVIIIDRQISMVANGVAITTAILDGGFTDSSTDPDLPTINGFAKHWAWTGSSSAYTFGGFNQGARPGSGISPSGRSIIGVGTGMTSGRRTRGRSYAFVIGD